MERSSKLGNCDYCGGQKKKKKKIKKKKKKKKLEKKNTEMKSKRAFTNAQTAKAWLNKHQIFIKATDTRHIEQSKHG